MDSAFGKEFAITPHSKKNQSLLFSQQLCNAGGSRKSLSSYGAGIFHQEEWIRRNKKAA
jgi:hypothetical protein